MRQHATPSTPARQTTAPSWLFAGTVEPIALVDLARAAILDTSGGVGEPETFGVRLDAAYRRFGAEGGRPGLTAATLEAARVGLDRYRGRQWRLTDEATIEEIRARSATPGDFGARVGNVIPSWFRCEGSDGARLVPRRLQPLVALVWWAYAAGRFGVLASTVELGAELGVDPRTIRAWRAEAVRIGLLRRGGHAYTDAAGVERPHDEVDRTWRPGRFKRPCDRARNLYRVGPVLEAFAGCTVAAASKERPPRMRGRARTPRRDAKKAAGALRRAARLSAYRRTGEVWERETARVRPPSGTPATRGPRPVSPERLARTTPAAMPPRPASPRPVRRNQAPATKGIARIVNPCTPDPIGPSAVRGLGPRTPQAPRCAREDASACSSAAPSAALPSRGVDASPVTTAPSPPGSRAQATDVRPEPPPRRVAADVPGRRPIPSAPDDDDRRLADALARLQAVLWTEEPAP